MSMNLLSTVPFVVFALGTYACSSAAELGELPETGDIETAPSTTETEGVPAACVNSPRFTCMAAVDCEEYDCGGPLDAFDADGCLRPSCEGGCAEDEVCFRPDDYGGCVSSVWSCEDNNDGVCGCGGTADCGGSYCLPRNEVPGDTDTDADGSSTGAFDSSSTGAMFVENGCGTFELGPHGDSVIPDDPGLPQIVAACDDLCSAAQAAGVCTPMDDSTCLERCQMRSCQMCPGVLADWAACEARVFSAEACTCTEDGPRCPDAPECEEFADRVSACGG